jgi:hypothetical protein
VFAAFGSCALSASLYKLLSAHSFGGEHAPASLRKTLAHNVTKVTKNVTSTMGGVVELFELTVTAPTKVIK